MKDKDRLRVLGDIDLLEEELEKYGPPKDGTHRLFMQDIDNPNIYKTGSDKKITKEEVDKYAKYSKIFIIVPASQMSKNRDKT